MYFCLLLMSGSGGCGTSGFVGSISVGMEAVCGCRVRICGRADCFCSALWETWSFCCSRTAFRVRMAGEKVSESVVMFSIPFASSLRKFCFCRLLRMYSFVLIAGSANCVVSVFGVTGCSCRDETGVFSLGRVRADGCTVGVVAGADGSVMAGACPSDRCSAGFAFPAGFSLTDASGSRTGRVICDWETTCGFS